MSEQFLLPIYCSGMAVFVRLPGSPDFSLRGILITPERFAEDTGVLWNPSALDSLPVRLTAVRDGFQEPSDWASCCRTVSVTTDRLSPVLRRR